MVLTGYPLQNNLAEYYCMIDFVRPGFLGTRRQFRNMFEAPILNGMCLDSTKEDVKLARYRIAVLIDNLKSFVMRFDSSDSVSFDAKFLQEISCTFTRYGPHEH